MTNLNLYVIRLKTDPKDASRYWTGKTDDYTTDLSRARFFSQTEMEVAFCLPNEEWHPIPNHGDA